MCHYVSHSFTLSGILELHLRVGNDYPVCICMFDTDVGWQAVCDILPSMTLQSPAECGSYCAGCSRHFSMLDFVRDKSIWSVCSGAFLIFFPCLDFVLCRGVLTSARNILLIGQ